MRKERDILKVSQLETNNGQLGWLPKNPRQWTQTDIDRTKASIQEDTDFLEDRPLLVCPGLSGKYVVFGGNLRLTAARSLKLKEVPVVVYCLDEGGPEQDEIRETVKRRAMKDNGSFGAWDYDSLANEWDDLPLQDWGVPAWEEEKDPATPEVKEDDFDQDAEVETRCKPGDIWQLGEHRLMCGDSTDPDAVSRLMAGNKADITFTSPPYNAGHLDILGNERTKKKYQNDDDSKTDSEYFNFLKRNMEILLNESEEVFYNLGVVSGSKFSIINVLYTFRDYFKDFIYWKKSNPVNAIAHGVISSSIELILCFGKNNTRRFRDTHFDNGEYYLGVIEGSVASSNEYAKIHKATFPMYLPENIIKNFTSINSLVLDCFGGTGTTLIAAEQLGRRCYMMELDPHYCDVILARWEQLTGKEARLITPGEKGPET